MSSWDSLDKTDHKIKINDKEIPLSYRVMYDTPSTVSYSLGFFTTDLIDVIKIVDLSEPEWIDLKSWGRESSNIDARNMSDIDVYDLFSTRIENYLLKNEKISMKMLKKTLSANMIEFEK